MIDETTIVAMVGGIILIVLLGMGLLATTLAWYHHRRDRHRRRRRNELRQALFHRLDLDDPNLDDWIAGMSATDRELLADIVLSYLRQLEGSARRPYLDAAEALWLGEAAMDDLDAEEPLDRVRALTTLSLLAHPIDRERLVDTANRDPRTAECAARLLYERRDEFGDARRLGTSLLVGDGSDPLSIYGLETLAALNTGGHSPLLELADEAADGWDRDLLVQVLSVIEHIDQIDPEAPIAWLEPYLTDDEPTVRAGAIRALKPQGWRESLRERIDLQALVDDPDPAVRRATYETLTYWGDASARELLTWAIVEEDDPRDQLVAIRGLLSMGAEPAIDSPGWPADAWSWIDAELAVADRRRLPADGTTEVGP